MEPSDVSYGSKTLNDVMYRRLKNRERQRRYRERKRLQVDPSNGHLTNQSSQMQMQMQIVALPTDGNGEQVVNRVHCRRDWKKDARRVHAAKRESISNGLLSSGQSLACENHMLHASLGMREAEQTLTTEVPSETCPRLNDSENLRSRLGRRDWKAEARNKK